MKLSILIPATLLAVGLTVVVSRRFGGPGEAGIGPAASPGSDSIAPDPGGPEPEDGPARGLVQEPDRPSPQSADDGSDEGTPAPADGPWEWSQVEERLKDQMCLQDPEGLRESLVGLPDPLTLERVRSEWGVDLSEAELRELQVLIEPEHVEVRSLADSYVDSLDGIYRGKYERREYVRTRLVEGMEPPARVPGESRHWFPGWVVTYSIRTEDHPEVTQVTRDLVDAKRRRDSLFREYLSGR